MAEPKAGAVSVVTAKQIAAMLAEKHELSKKQAEALVSETFGLVVSNLVGGNKVRVAGLGTLQVKDRPARTARNPATGATIQVAASKKVSFTVAKELKETI